jgi:hypothetical protein
MLEPRVEAGSIEGRYREEVQRLAGQPLAYSDEGAGIVAT